VRKVYRMWRTIIALFFVGNAVLALLVALIYGVVAVVFGLPFWSPGLGIPARFEAFTKSLAGLWFFGCVVVIGVGYYAGAFVFGTGSNLAQERAHRWLFSRSHDQEVMKRIETHARRYEVIGAAVGIGATLVVAVLLLLVSTVNVYQDTLSQWMWLLFWPGIALFLGIPLVALLRYAEKHSVFSQATFRRFVLSRCVLIAILLVVLMLIVAVFIPLLYSGLDALGRFVFNPLVETEYARAHTDLETRWDEILESERYHPADIERDLTDAYWDAAALLDIKSITVPSETLALKYGAQLVVVLIVLLFLVPLLAFRFKRTLWFIFFALVSSAVGWLLDCLLDNVFKLADGTLTAIVLTIGFILLNEFTFDSLEEEMTEHEAYCQACGAEISADDRYCRRCGSQQAIRTYQ